MFWPWILLPIAFCCCNDDDRRGRRRRNPCRRLDDPDAIFPRTNVYRAAKPCRPRERD